MTRINATVEVRMGSTRLPGKTMMQVLSRPMIELLLERLRLSKKIRDIIVATTVNAEDDVIEAFCEEKGYICFRGSSEDVLGRVHAAAKKYSTDALVEVTGDCPLIDPWLIDKCLDIFLASDCDYLSNFIEQSYPPGIDVQIFAFKALDEMSRLAKEPKFREHVSLYALEHPDKFSLRNVKAPPELTFPNWHLELDEPKDFDLIKIIYEALYPKNKRFTTADIIGLLKARPELLEINKDVKRAWEKLREEEGII